MRHERGQATVDYVGVLLLLAVVFAAAVGVLAASGLGEQVVASMRRALCIVTGGPCDAAERAARGPCVVSAERHTEGGALTISVLRIGERHVMLRERRSDGTIALTLADEEAIGADFGSGVRAHAQLGALDFAVGREMRAAVLAQDREAKTWIVPDDARAEETIRQLRLADNTFGRRAGFRAPEPAVTYHDSGTGLALDLAGRVELSDDFAYGERQERASGRRTVYVRDGAEGAVSLAFGSGSAAREERFGVTFDREDRPVDLVVVSVLDVSGSVDLPAPLAAIAGWLRLPTEGARYVETEQHLDLTDPLNADAASLFLRGFANDRAGLRMAAAALRERLEERGTLNVRTYATESEERGFGVRAKGIVVGGGMEYGEERESMRLVAALARRPDGTWGDDAFCVAA